MSDIGGHSSDSGMVRVMGIVGIALFVLALGIGVTANLLDSDDEGIAGDPLMRNALIQRIAPVGGVRTSSEELLAAVPAGEAAGAEIVADAGALRGGQELVDGACAACHIAGVAGAPLLDDVEAWADRREVGLDALVASVINGKGAMPARGGSPYTDEEIEIAVRYMAMFEDDTGADTGADTGVDTGVEAPEITGAVEPAAPVDPSDTADASDAAPEVPEVPVEPAVAETPTAPASDETAALADEALIEEVSDANPAITAAAEVVDDTIVVGQAPAELSDNVRTTVDGVCIGCHLAGVAGAPKVGDAAAWQARADLGLSALTQAVINGKGVMPARGGSALTDAEIPIAIQYLMSK